MRIQLVKLRKRNEYNEGDVVLLIDWISKIKIKNPTSK